MGFNDSNPNKYTHSTWEKMENSITKAGATEEGKQQEKTVVTAVGAVTEEKPQGQIVVTEAADVKEEKLRGKIVVTRAGSVEWVKRCPTLKYAPVLSHMDTKIKGYGITQSGNEIWFCGGQGSWSYTCQILSLLDGKWRIFEHKMNHARI